jgi:hypothetical protein
MSATAAAASLLKQWRFERDRYTIHDMLLRGDPGFERLLRRGD